MAEISSPVIWFEDVGRSDVARLRGKNTSPGEMVQHRGKHGMAVPAGFASTAQAYRNFVEANRLTKVIGRYVLCDRRDRKTSPPGDQAYGPPPGSCVTCVTARCVDWGLILIKASGALSGSKKLAGRWWDNSSGEGYKRGDVNARRAWSGWAISRRCTGRRRRSAAAESCRCYQESPGSNEGSRRGLPDHQRCP